MPAIELKKINKIYPNGFQAVYNFNLSINDGEFIILVGPSGCGKSTTLRMIAGLEDITEGDFLVDGVKANALSPKERGVAMVFQSYALYPHLTVYDNLAFGLNLEGLDEEIIEQKVHNIAKTLGLSDYLERKPRELSGGQCQRVALGRAIIRKVKIFLMDEPLSNLDAKQRVTTRSDIIDLHRKIKATTIYVTHDQTEAMTMADRIVVMKDGYIQQVGTPAELYFEPINAFVAGFIGEPPMNFISAKIHNHAIYLDDTDYVLEVPHKYRFAQEQNILFGFRPESIILDNGEEINDEYYTFTSKIEITELLGDNTNVYALINKHNIILRVDPHDIVGIKDECRFKVLKKDVYLFNKENGCVIKHDGE